MLRRGAQRLALALRDVVAVEPWRVPIPAEGAALRLASGGRWRYGLAHAERRRIGARARCGGCAGAGERAVGRDRVCASAPGGPARPTRPPAREVRGLSAAARAAGVSPAPAHRVRQHLRRVLHFGLAAYLTTFALWWAAWAIGVVLCAAALRAVIEAGTLTAVWWRPASGVAARRVLEACGRAALYLGLPAWLLLRAVLG